jgi:hypothetical protein
MNNELIDRGSYYEIKNFQPIIGRDENGNATSLVYCPYIPKFIIDGIKSQSISAPPISK